MDKNYYFSVKVVNSKGTNTVVSGPLATRAGAEAYLAAYLKANPKKRAYVSGPAKPLK